MFGFVDPNNVVCAIHIIPAFHFGHTSSLLGTSIAHQEIEKDEDWDWYYINMFVDRDMFMQFHGGGVGHKMTHEVTCCLLDDQDKLDNALVTLEWEHAFMHGNEDSDSDGDDVDK
ncbi:hypothetical protein BKA82DRAFT_4457721, partial [Pisolithus tinctorius]